MIQLVTHRGGKKYIKTLSVQNPNSPEGAVLRHRRE